MRYVAQCRWSFRGDVHSVIGRFAVPKYVHSVVGCFAVTFTVLLAVLRYNVPGVAVWEIVEIHHSFVVCPDVKLNNASMQPYLSSAIA